MNDPERHLMTIFSVAIECGSSEEREAYLRQACGGNPDLRARVHALLRAHERAKDVLGPENIRGESTQPGTPIGGGNCVPVEATSAGVGLRPDSGTLIGVYKIIEPIDEGGMGTVYRAEQTSPVRRMVALKVIKPGMDSRQVLARFEAERQAIALMDHPNIAKVLDAGTTIQGRPYFVMELVKGVPITRFCDEHRLTPRERLELFIPVCQAVQHAHQKGIIHRDIKPSNVLVGLYDGVPIPKVIDFGVAKATGQKLTEDTLFTGFGAVVGTPEYMSPEQAQLDNIDIDTRSDIYSLGVLLYELLTGTTPIDRKRFHQGAILEVLRMIREVEPPQPSKRLSRTEELPSIAANRNVEPRKLTGLVRGELDWIVMKALEKNRNRRYETANGLGADLRRYLADEPVSACPPSRRYRLQKLVHRHRHAFLGLSLLFLSLMGGIIGTTWGLLRAQEEKGRVIAESTKTAIALRAKELALADARASKRDASLKLLESYEAQARASRLTRRPGQRFESLDALMKATALARELHLPENAFHTLRDDVIATLALPDLALDPDGPVFPWDADAFAFDVDAAYVLYARTNRHGDCTVRRVSDDVEVHRFDGLGFLAWPALSRDGRFLAVGHRTEGLNNVGMGLHVWDLTERPAKRVATEQDQHSLEFDPDGRRLVFSHGDGSISVLELPSGRRLHHLPPIDLTREVQVAIHPTEPLVAVSSYFNPVVQIRDLRSGEVIARLPQDANPGSVAWHPDGHTLAVGLVEAHAFRLYDRASLRLIRTIHADDGVIAMSFSHDGGRIATAGWGWHIEAFDAGTGRKLFTTSRKSTGIRFNRDDVHLAAAVDNDTLRVYRLADGQECRMLVRSQMAEGERFSCLPTVSPDSRILATTTVEGFGLWDLAVGAELAFIPTGGHENRILFEPNGDLLVLCPAGLMRWPLSGGDVDGRLVLGPPEYLGLPRGDGLAQSADGRVIATCSRAIGANPSNAGGWILHADRPVRPIRIDPGADLVAIALSPDGALAVTFAHSPAGLTKIWNAHTGELVKELPERLTSLPNFSSDGRWLSTSIDGGRLLKVGTWELGPRTGGTARFAPDGRTLVCQDGAGGFRLVETDTGRTLATLADPLEPTDAPNFSPDGGLVIGLAIGETKGLRVWDLRLIRRRLDELGLDWDAPEIPPAKAISAPLLSIEVLRGRSHYDTGITLAQNQRFDQAAAELRKAIEINPRDAAAHEQLGLVLIDLKQADEAITHYRKSLEIDPTRASTHNNYGNILMIQGNLNEAIACFRRSLELLPGYVRAHDNLGNALRAQGKLDEAISAYRQVAELEPRCAYHANLLAWLLVTREFPTPNDSSEAIAHATRAVEIEPASSQYWNTLGVARYRAGQWESAIDALEKSRSLRGDAHFAQDAFFLALCHIHLGHQTDARDWYARAVEWMNQHMPQDAELKRFRAEAEALLKVNANATDSEAEIRPNPG